MTEPVLDEIARRYRLVAADRAVDGERLAATGVGPRLVSALAVDVYTYVHARSIPAVVATADAPHTPASAAAFLGVAPEETTFADQGWSIRSRPGRLVVKGGLVLHLPEPACGARDPLAGAASGTAFPVDLPCERLRAVPGCYLRLGMAGPCPAGAAARVYLHPVAAIAGRVFAHLCQQLDAAGVRFSAKVFNSPNRCQRADAIVAEFARADRAAVLVAAKGAGPRASDAPGFCVEIVRGIGYAEQAPGSPGGSLGRHRALLAAEGLVAAFRAGANDTAGRRRAIVAVFRGCGLDDRRPWAAAAGAVAVP